MKQGRERGKKANEVGQGIRSRFILRIQFIMYIYIYMYPLPKSNNDELADHNGSHVQIHFHSDHCFEILLLYSNLLNTFAFIWRFPQNKFLKFSSGSSLLRYLQL